MTCRYSKTSDAWSRYPRVTSRDWTLPVTGFKKLNYNHPSDYVMTRCVQYKDAQRKLWKKEKRKEILKNWTKYWFYIPEVSETTSKRKLQCLKKNLNFEYLGSLHQCFFFCFCHICVFNVLTEWLTVISTTFSPEGSSCSPLVVGQGVIVQESCTKAPSPRGTVCDLACPNGMKLMAPPFQQCGNEGIWTPPTGSIRCGGKVLWWLYEEASRRCL